MMVAKLFDGESAGARTQDQRLKRAMLYQLSYALVPLEKGNTSRQSAHLYGVVCVGTDEAGSGAALEENPGDAERLQRD